MVLEAMSDFELVREARDGSNNAFAVLVGRYRQSLINLSMRYVHDDCSYQPQP